jgi:hypothetical protein
MISMMPLHTTLSGQLLIFFLYAGTQGGQSAVGVGGRAKTKDLRAENSRLKQHLSANQLLYLSSLTKIKTLQQKIRRSKQANQRRAMRAPSACTITQDDAKLLRIIKTAEEKLKREHTEHFEGVFRKLAEAILDKKLLMDSIELEYICNLAVNMSKNYANQLSYTDNIMRFCSAMLKLSSGRAVLELFTSASPDNGSSSAEPITKRRLNWHFPSENSINDWDVRHDVDPKFSLGISEKTIEYIHNNTEGVLRFGCNATDSHGVAGFLPGGKFDGGDVFFPGSGYDATKLEQEYSKLAGLVETYARNPSLLDSASEEELTKFLGNCKTIGNFLEAGVDQMESNLSALQKKMSDNRARYQQRQTELAEKKKKPAPSDEGKDKKKTKTGADDAKGGNKQAAEDSVSDLSVCLFTRVCVLCICVCASMCSGVHVYVCVFGCICARTYVCM